MGQAQITAMEAAAARAPSVHNTRPWRFDGHGDDFEVYADPARRLEVLDPTGRQLHLSCGAAIEFAYLAARADGRDCDVAIFPDAHQPSLLARLSTGSPRPATDEEKSLAGAIAVRHTDRGAYRDDQVPPEVLADATRRATELGAWLRRIDRPDDRRALMAVLAAAEQAEAADPDYAAELARWTRTEDSGPGLAPESIAVPWPQGRVSDVQLRDFTGADQHPRPGDDPEGPPPAIERDLLLLIGTEADDPGSWVTAGRALGWTLLRATASGVAAQPLGQAIDLQGGRERLRHELGLVGHPQFVLRLGLKG